MAEVHRDANGNVVHKSNTGRNIAIILLVIVGIVGILFATGFWSADVKEGALPNVEVSAEGGQLPEVDVDSKEVVVGTKKQEIDVPVVGVRDGDGD